MGFLDNLVKKSIKNTISDVTKSAQKSASDTIGKAVGNAITNSLGKALGVDPSELKQSSNAGSSSSSSSSTGFGASESTVSSGKYDNYFQKPKLNKEHKESFTPDLMAVASSVSDRGSAAYFADIIEKNVPGATVETKVPLSKVSSESFAKQVPIDVLVSVDGAAKLAIVIPSKNQYRNMAYINTMNACEAAGISAIRFMKEFANEPGYVSARVKAVIG